jgi:transcription initiation factor TFIID subunit 1
LDNLRFDNDTVAWDGDVSVLLERARTAPLILELGVAGQSVANKVFQNTILQRPTPAAQTEAYRRRVERDWGGTASTNAADAATGTNAASTSKLHGNKDQQLAIIEERQMRRAKMAEDKTSRVTKALGTVASALGGGRGRTITSSLMGPGGTERTGRPTRVGAGTHETEYVEQLDLITSHALVRTDFSKILLREYMRPKLPLSVVRSDLSWQFQIRYVPAGKKTDASGQSSSYQAIMMGTHAGAISKERLRSEADLSPTEGKLVLLEYSEERPPLQLTKGMCSKIVNYYRGDKARCPVSAGGGDRPARRKRGDNTAAVDGAGAATDKSNDRPPRLEGPNRKTNILDWVGKLPSKSQKDRSEKEAIDVLPEGVTEILHPKVHGPFVGEVEEGMTLTGLVNNLFVAPLFRHEPESTDFLMTLTPPSGAASAGRRDVMGVVLRELPPNIFTVGQTEPRTRVMAPGSQGEKNFLNPFVSYQIARTLTRAQAREGHGLRLDEISERVLPSYGLPQNALRQRLKQVAVFEKTTSIWTTKPIGYEEYPGVDALGRTVSPESVAAFESELAARQRLTDLGIHQLVDRGAHTVVSVGVTMFYLSARLNALREVAKKAKKLAEHCKTNRTLKPLQIVLSEKASEELETQLKALKQKHEVAQFIYEELQLAPWHLTGEFMEVHKKGEGTGMMKLTGLGKRIAVKRLQRARYCR